jgi:serine/threonine protein kinase
MRDAPDGSFEWIGLPQCLKKQLSVFSREEIAAYPGTLLKVVLGQLYSPKQELKDSGEISKQIRHAANIQQENPSQFYKVVGKEGAGGFARVFRCQRIRDGQLFALKFTEPKGAAERQAIENEIGIMQMGQCDSIVQCYEAFDFQNRLWIFMELMDGGAFTPMLEELQGQYSEEFCKYSLYMTCKGLIDLHR